MLATPVDRYSASFCRSPWMSFLPLFFSDVFSLVPTRKVLAKYPIQTVIKLSKYNRGLYVTFVIWLSSPMKNKKPLHINTNNRRERLALASNQMLICNGFELIQKTILFLMTHFHLKQYKKFTVASHGILKRDCRRYKGLVARLYLYEDIIFSCNRLLGNKKSRHIQMVCTDLKRAEFSRQRETGNHIQM